MKRLGAYLGALSICFLVFSPVSAQDYPNLEDTRHDLAVYLRPPFGATDDDPRCVFCHAPRGHSLS